MYAPVASAARIDFEDGGAGGMRPRLGMRDLIVTGLGGMCDMKTCCLAARQNCTCAQHNMVSCELSSG